MARKIFTFSPNRAAVEMKRRQRQQDLLETGEIQRLLGADAEESPTSGDAFELVFAPVEEFDVGPGDEVGDGSGDEYFARSGVGGDSLADVDGNPGDVVSS